jgi:hypothetical protein
LEKEVYFSGELETDINWIGNDWNLGDLIDIFYWKIYFLERF